MLEVKAYKFMLKVTKFQLPTICRFSTTEGKTWLWVDSTPPGPFRVKVKDLYWPHFKVNFIDSSSRGGQSLTVIFLCQHETW